MEDDWFFFSADLTQEQRALNDEHDFLTWLDLLSWNSGVRQSNQEVISKEIEQNNALSQEELASIIKQQIEIMCEEND